jgi:hypothetical protein
VFFGVGSIMQAVLGILVTLFYIVAVSHLSPYDEPTNNLLAVVDHCALLVLLLQVVMIKYHIAVETIPTPTYEPGYSASFINTTLVSTLAVTGLISGVMIAIDVMRTETAGPDPDPDEGAEGMRTTSHEESNGNETDGQQRSKPRDKAQWSAQVQSGSSTPVHTAGRVLAKSLTKKTVV